MHHRKKLNSCNLWRTNGSNADFFLAQVQFEDIFGEPEGAHSIDCAWKSAFKCYEGGRNCCYKCLTVCCAWFFALCWGCEFACLTFFHIWYMTPCRKTVEILCGAVQSLCGAYFDCCIGPVCASIGMVFSNIKVTQG